jgi:hypothetical protein
MFDPIQISGGEFESLEAMMCAHAARAVQIAADDHGMALDYSPHSIAQLETVLSARTPVPENEVESATRLWGAYFGEVFRRRYPGEWIMAVYPGREISMPALDIGGSHVYPLLKIFRRLTLGPCEDLAGFYAKVSTTLDAQRATKAGPQP